MDSMKNFAEIEFQKDLVSNLLKQSFIDIDDTEYEEFTDLILGKIHLMNSMRTKVEEEAGDTLAETAERYETTTDHIIDAYLYFTLIVENVFLARKLIEATEDSEDE